MKPDYEAGRRIIENKVNKFLGAVLDDDCFDPLGVGNLDALEYIIGRLDIEYGEEEPPFFSEAMAKMIIATGIEQMCLVFI